jgi:hypothetical protein
MVDPKMHFKSILGLFMFLRADASIVDQNVNLREIVLHVSSKLSH